jgi:cytochrome c peroxidase
MNKSVLIASILALGAVAACGGKKDDNASKGSGTATTTTTTTTSTTSTGTGTGTNAPAESRPSQGPLPTVQPLQLPDDPKRKEKAELGHALFFDKRLSGDGSKACINCHENADGNGGHDPLAQGVGGPLPRHAPVLWNTAYFIKAWAWDGHLDSLEAQVKGAVGGKAMGVGDDKLEDKAAELAKIPGYKALFDAAFPGTPVTFDEIAGAIAAYEDTLVCNDTKYDRFAAGDKGALSDSEQKGLDIFMGKGMCSACHAPPMFSTAMGAEGGVYFNVGVGTQGKAEADVDPGRMKVTNVDTDWAAFKPPSLRNVTKSAPYFHDGSAATLDDALKVMAGGGIPNKNLTAIQQDRKLSDEEKTNLKAFLGSLECPETIDPPAKMP